MSRLLKALPLALAIVAIVALGLFAASCNSSNHALVRIINAVANEQSTLDVYINGTNGTKIPSLGFGVVYPTQQSNQSAQYASLPSGNVTITAYVNGETTNPVNNGNTALGASTQYTVILQGLASANNAPAVLTDTNAALATNTVEFRVINASPSSPGLGVDVYIYETGGAVPGTPQIAGLTLGQGTYATPLSYFAGGFNVFVNEHGAGNNGIPYFNYQYAPANGSITTFVILDTNDPWTAQVSPSPIVLTDLQ